MGTYNLLDSIPSTEWAAIENFTSTYDCTTALQALCDITDIRKVINLPAGQINTSNRIYFNTHNIRLRGDGCLWNNIGMNNLAALWINGWAGWELSGFRMFGNIAGRIPRVPGAGESLIVAANCWNWAMEGIDLENSYADSIQLGATSSDPNTRARQGYMKNIRMQDAGRNGITFGGCVDILGEHLHTYDITNSMPMSGFALEPAYGTANEDICLVQPLAEGSTQHGLYCSGLNPTVTIVGGSFHTNGGWGILKGGAPVSLVGIQSFSSNTLGNVGP